MDHLLGTIVMGLGRLFWYGFFILAVIFGLMILTG